MTTDGGLRTVRYLANMTGSFLLRRCGQRVTRTINQPGSEDDLSFVPGEIYEDCAYHPCLCVSVDKEGDEIWGISLIDGSHPRSCSLSHCGVIKLTVDQAWRIKQRYIAKMQGRQGRAEEKRVRWWED